MCIRDSFITLSETATQQDYIRIQARIDEKVDAIPIVKEKDVYRTTIESLEEKQDFLVQQVADWETSYTPSMTREQANTLKEKINRQRDRYTNETSKQRFNDLLNRLDNIILERQTKERDDEALKQSYLMPKGN